MATGSCIHRCPSSTPSVPWKSLTFSPVDPTSQPIHLTRQPCTCETVRQIDETSWLVGTRHILRHVQGPAPKENDCLWENIHDGSHYTLSPAPTPPPDAGPLALSGHARKIHDAGDGSAVFNFGDALIIKVRTATANTLGANPKHWRFSPDSNSASTFPPSSCSSKTPPRRT